MKNSLRRCLIVSILVLAGPSLGLGQQAPQPPVQAPPVPAGFQLNAVQQAYLDQVLSSWQNESAKVTIFQCPFERWEYNQAFGPGNGIPLKKNKGELSYQKPDKGSFEITEIRVWDQATNNWVLKKDAIGEHWVCDGKSVYEFRSDQKQVIERPLPPHAPGESIIDGPLPFLFGAESAKLKQKYWMRIDQRNNNPDQIWLNALPKFQQQAADFRQVDVILDRKRQLPQAMQVTLPNGDRHVYMFHLEKASINNPLDRIQQALFDRPRTPFGWKHVVENAPMPVAQAPQPAQQPQVR